MTKEWRPDDWKNPYPVGHEFHLPWEHGASAMLSAVIKWLDEPCDNHAHLVDNRDRVDASRVEVIPLPTGKYKASYLHRKDCPQCMAELRGEK